MRSGLLGLAVLLISASSSAGVFNINKETFAAYFNMTAGGSAIGTSALDGEAASNITYSGDVNYNYTGEFGFVYSRPAANLKFGFEILKPMNLSGSSATSGSELYTADSEILGYVPKLTAEINLHSDNISRSFFAASVGAANLTLKNTYNLTATGQAAYPGVAAQHEIEAKGSATLIAAGLGYEGLLSDSTTLTCEFGYRKLLFDNMTYAKDATTFSGSHSSGDDFAKASGGKRDIDLSGAYISIGFRFYL